MDNSKETGRGRKRGRSTNPPQQFSSLERVVVFCALLLILESSERGVSFSVPREVEEPRERDEQKVFFCPFLNQCFGRKLGTKSDRSLVLRPPSSGASASVLCSAFLARSGPRQRAFCALTNTISRSPEGQRFLLLRTTFLRGQLRRRR